jgi:hypothetical protein
LSTAAERLATFCSRIDEYIICKNLGVSKFNPEWALAETFDIATIGCLTQQECFDYAFMLYQLADHVGQERASQENVARWCESSLNSILTQEMDSQAIAKHEIKVARVLLENDLAAKIDEWKQHAQSRLAKLTNREYNIRRKADILIEKGKRK